MRLGLDAGRVDLKGLTSKIEELLSAKWGAGKYISRVAYTDLYFAPGVYDRLKQDQALARQLLSTVERVPGIARVLLRDQLSDPPGTDDPVIRAARLNYMPSRSGDVILVPKPYWLMSTAAATHGTHHGYDKHVPVLFYGAGIRPGRYWEDASPADIAPTLAALCGVTLARTDGHVLSAALESAPRPERQSAGRK